MSESLMPFGERRLYNRKVCSRMIEVDDSEQSYSGHMRDLAIGGAFIEPAFGNESEIGQELILTIPFELRQDHLTIKAKVAWKRPSGIGVRFLSRTSGY